MSNANNSPPVPPYTGPGSPQDVPPVPGSSPIDPNTLPKPIRDELLAPDPVAIETSAAELQDGLNRCPKCGATDIRQKPGSDLLICQYCRHEWHGERVEEEFGLGTGLDQLEGTVVASGAQDIKADAASLMTFKCTGCGAEVTVNTANAMTARCHWCRHVFGVNEQVANGAVPKEQFTPENVVGVYLPYMIVDGNASADVAGQGEIETRRYTQGSGNNKKTYYDADVYQLDRHVDFTVDDLPLESSTERGNLDTRINTNNIINTILPFDTKNAVKWNASYLMGLTTEKRDRDVEQLRPRLEDQLLSIARAQVEASVGRYDRGVRWEQERLSVHGTRWVAMYLPVWLYSYHQPGPNGGLLHYIAVNGRTGETMGSVPVQQWKLLMAALTVGTFLEGIALLILGNS